MEQVPELKTSEAWQCGPWARWPREEDWPAKLDIYEAAAYLRVSPDTIRRALIVARDGRAWLAHQRLGATCRIRKADLEVFGAVAGRPVAAGAPDLRASSRIQGEYVECDLS